jgi:putative MFS transporter
LLGGLSAYAFAVADTEAVYITALFFVGFFNLGAWGAVYPYTAELFPTRLRSSAFGLMEGVGKAAAIAGPYIFGNLKDATGSTTWSLTFVAIVMAVGGVVAGIFGRETRGQKLAYPPAIAAMTLTVSPPRNSTSGPPRSLTSTPST